MAARAPRPLIPNARTSLAVIAGCALVGAGLGLLGAPSPSLPSFSISLPLQDSGDAVPATANPVLLAALPQLQDILPLSRDLIAAPDQVVGVLTNGEAARVWPDPGGAKRRLDGWGRTGGYQASYARQHASTSANAVLSVWADVSSFRSVDGAGDALRDLQERVEKAGAVAAGDVAPFAEASAAYVLTDGSLTTFYVLFRRGAVTGWLVVTGLADGLKLEAVGQLARTMSERAG